MMRRWTVLQGLAAQPRKARPLRFMPWSNLPTLDPMSSSEVVAKCHVICEGWLLRYWYSARSSSSSFGARPCFFMVGYTQKKDQRICVSRGKRTGPMRFGCTPRVLCGCFERNGSYRRQGALVVRPALVFPWVTLLFQLLAVWLAVQCDAFSTLGAKTLAAPRCGTCGTKR